MNILVINCGSSSLKYQLLNMQDESVLAIGLAERIGIEGSQLKHETLGKDKVVLKKPMPNHKEAIKIVLDTLTDKEMGVISSLEEIQAVGHRVVHGGEKFASSVLITEEVIEAMDDCIELAPLHNPPNIIGIRACQELMPNVPMVGVFDTAFHQTMPEYSYIYPLPYELYKELGIRKYGFHGTSHKYVSQRLGEITGQDITKMKIVSCHLGNGASLAAINNGKSMDTSMGLTPLEGLAMGTRSGNLDPAIITFLMEKKNLSIDEVNNLMNKESGVLGISGVSSDFRDIEDAVKQGNKRAQLALDKYYFIVRKYIGSYAAAMGGLDAVIFTAGLGENSPDARATICEGLEFLGIEIDPERNNVRGKETLISKEGTKVQVYLIPTNEELMIARDTEIIVKDLTKA
ncbi:MAG: acetate kinase [Dethiosulfatibacter sp.]|nr:acetate kinase [Dethiosulfatibacter sp.]